MICNAGFGFYGTVEDTGPDVMRQMMDVNFMGTFFVREQHSRSSDSRAPATW